ncbi:MAG: C-glycoside deglycosidase beta subunit domain-containing protein [Saccharofermentanales bacterium]|jgi:hypothetical protein|nr:hypothetical protein [Clostridiaceae bacterium]
MDVPFKTIIRKSIGMGQNDPDFDKIADFQGPRTRFNPLILADYGRNIYNRGQRIGYCLDIRICGYRGLPINQIRALTFEVDGVAIPEESLSIWYENRQHPFADVGTDKIEINWFWKYGDYLRIFIEVPGGIEQGIHDVKFGLALRDHYSSTAYCAKPVTIV